MMNFSAHEINERLDELVSLGLFGKNFKFRTKQKEVILTIAHVYLNKLAESIIIEAPTGSGKSVIAMITSKLLESFDSTGYVLTSDLSLQSQYEADFSKYDLKWGTIKGIDNYSCSVNDLSFSLGECRIRNMSYKQAESLACFHTCGYLQNRKKAIHSRISLLNYSFWLLQRNYVAKKQGEDGEEESFPQRDFTFFDEAHKIPDIVQNHFAPTVDYKIVDNVNRLYDELRHQGINISALSKSQFNANVDALIKETDKSNLLNGLISLKNILIPYHDLSDYVRTKIKELFPINATPTTEWRLISSLMDKVKDTFCKVEDYIDIILEVGLDKLVKIKNSEESVTFKCLDERHMIKKHLLEKSRFKIFMSATIGDPKRYMVNMAITDAKLIKLGNTFDFSKSPIIIGKKYRMSFSKKDENFPHVLAIHDQIIGNFHKNEKGIVHTGSYDITDKIKKNSSVKDRLIIYNNSVSKKLALQEFEISHNKILIGPSLLEGLDFKDDMSRFQIFFKVPYPSLSDPFIKEKLEESQDWYNYKTAISILQGIGRSVRNSEDWAKTYFLDACFYDFYNKNKEMFPLWFNERIKK